MLQLVHCGFDPEFRYRRTCYEAFVQHEITMSELLLKRFELCICHLLFCCHRVLLEIQCKPEKLTLCQKPPVSKCGWPPQIAVLSHFCCDLHWRSSHVECRDLKRCVREGRKNFGFNCTGRYLRVMTLCPAMCACLQARRETTSLRVRRDLARTRYQADRHIVA